MIPRLLALYLTSITSGFCMMALEIAGSRYLSPYFGTDIDVWAAIITVFIASLSIGYVAGGRLADRWHSNLPLALVLTGAGIFFVLLPLYARPLQQAFSAEFVTARGSVLVPACLLFLPPSLLLGSVSPMLVKLVFTTAHTVGRTTGTLYAIGSVGNVLGILATNFILLMAFELNTITIAMGIVLLITGLLHMLIKLRILDPRHSEASFFDVDTNAETLSETEAV